MTSPPKGDPIKVSNGQVKPRSVPKKFIFDTSGPEENHDSNPLGKEAKSSVSIPILQEFGCPQDCEQAYQRLSGCLVDVFNEVRELLTMVRTEKLDEAIKNLNFTEPESCLKFMREVIFKCVGGIDNLNSKENTNNQMGVYEKLLQKAEIKIRDLIRNEQIYRITFDQYAIKHDEFDRAIADLQFKLEEYKNKNENLTRESTKLMAVLRQKDEEIKALTVGKPNRKSDEFSEICSPMLGSTRSDSLEQSKTTKVRHLDLQNMKVVLNTHHPTMSDSSRWTPLDSNRIKHDNKATGRETGSNVKNKSFDRSGGGKSMTSTSGFVTNLKITGIEKLKEVRESLKNRIEFFTDRKKTEISADRHLNNSDRHFENYNFPAPARQTHKVTSNVPSSLIQQQQQENLKNRSSPKVGIRTEKRKNEKNKSIQSVRIRPSEDNFFPLKTEPSEDHGILTDKFEKRKAEEMDQKYLLKNETYQSLSSVSKRKTATFKERPIATAVHTEPSGDSYERSSEFKSAMLKNKSIVQGNISLKTLAKEKSPKLDNNKIGQNSTVFMNIMLKKLATQKSQSKKTL